MSGYNGFGYWKGRDGGGKWGGGKGRKGGLKGKGGGGRERDYKDGFEVISLHSPIVIHYTLHSVLLAELERWDRHQMWEVLERAGLKCTTIRN